MSAAELQATHRLEQIFSKHFTVVNDIYSYEKEVKKSQTGHREGAVLCSAIKILSDETGLHAAASKRVLWSMVREWETVFDQLAVEARLQDGVDKEKISAYCEGLRWQLSGNEVWSTTTKRYN